MLAIPQNYGSIIIDVFKKPTVDILSGPVFYGYGCGGAGYFNIPLRAPELMLGNRAIHTRHSARISGATLGEPFFPTDGPNIVFRMSAYCAAGGYNYEVDLGEDIYIGAAIFGLRNERLELFPRPSHAVYSREFWLATDPRRQLGAICAGYSIVESWSFIPFSDILGSSMSTRELISAYTSNKEFIQCDDLKGLDISSVSDKIKLRTLAVFRDAIKDDCLEDDVMRSLGNHYGLIDVRHHAGSCNLTSEMVHALKCCFREHSH
nr:hypothetical protein [Rhizobium rhizogenes]